MGVIGEQTAPTNQRQKGLQTTMTKTITILGEEFTVPQPYAEGHTISAIEAKVLNQTFAENIANNQRKNIKAAQDGGEGAPTMDEVRADFAKYAAGYAFTEAAAGGSRATLSPLEKEALKLARELVMAKLKETGRKKKDVSEDDFNAAVAKMAENEQVLKVAKKRLKDNESLAEVAGLTSEGSGESDDEAAAA